MVVISALILQSVAEKRPPLEKLSDSLDLSANYPFKTAKYTLDHYFG
uniref:Uncharacterized protein n=1 Tax=Arundo donax TaxID=35708 RepID=A0A0A9A8F8_ARUDO